jgi:hypothetical protein
MMKIFAACLLAALLCAPVLFAEDAAPAGGADTQAAAASGAVASGAGSGGSGAGDEGDFFGAAPVEAPKGTADKQNLIEDVEKERVGLSGILQATGTYNLTRDFVLNGAAIQTNPFSGMLTGDFLVDIRLKKSFRAFIDLDVGYVNGGTPVPINLTTTNFVGTIPPGTLISATQSQTTLLGVREFFVDFNAANTVYFRAGKQVLQWGTGYFWNPTDLINIEHKSFTNLTALLDGVFGLRTDVVFAREFHLYTFVNVNSVTDISGVALAARAEFLLGTFEFGFSAWAKPDKIPVFGTDLTTPLFWNINLTGEASFSWGDNQDKYDPVGLQPYSIRDRLVPKVDVGLSRSFDAGNVQDRIMVNAEFFYNDSGYDQNMFQALNGSPGLLTFLTGGYFQPGYYGKCYGALFVTINQFIIHDMTLSVSGLGNFSDLTGIALAMLTYTPVNNFELSLQLGGYVLGASNGEYTVSVNPSTGALGANMFFASLEAKVSF